MTEPMYKPPAPLTPPQCPPGMVELNGRCIREFIPDEKQLAPEPQPYLNATEGLSGIGRAMRDRAMGAGMMQRPTTPARPDGEMMEKMPRPPDEVYKKGGRVKRKSVKSSASKRADGIASRGKTKGRFI